MQMVWERPKQVPYPNVWRRFKGKISIDGKILEYTIKDLTDDLVEPCITHMVKHFLVREPFTSHDGLVEDEISLKALEETWRKKISQRVALVAIVDGGGPESKRIAGVNILCVTEKDELPKQGEGRGMQRILKLMTPLYEKENLFEKYGVDFYLNAMGLSVSAKYKGDNVGYHLLAARDALCRACGIPLAVTCFSNLAAIHEAKKAGYEIIQEITADKIQDPAYPRLKDNIFVLTSRIMAAI